LPNSTGTAATLTSSPSCRVLYSSTGSPPYQETVMGITVDPDSGTVLVAQPVVLAYGTTANLTLGGSHTDGIPNDVQFFLAINNGPNKATAPADDVYGNPQYDGTVYTIEGVQRTLYVQVDGWRDPSNNAGMVSFASEILDSVKNTVVEGSIQYAGLYTTGLTP